MTPRFLRYCGQVESAKMAGWLACAVVSGAVAFDALQSESVADFCLGVLFSLAGIVCAAQTLIQFKRAKAFFDEAGNAE